MSSNYLTFFGLNDNPFRMTPDTAYFYPSQGQAAALLALEYCVREKEGFCILTGEPGTGKSATLRVFIESMKQTAEIAQIITPRLSPEEFLPAILEELKIPLRSGSKNDMLKDFRDFLLVQAGSDRRVVIIVDEAQELPETTLEELRLLSNLETEKEKLLQIILVGQPELRSKLLVPSLRQLNQRIAVRVRLERLTPSESSVYIGARVNQGGNSSPLYGATAKSLIYTLSGGIPRTVNLLASRSLMAAFLDGSREVGERHVRRGADDILEAGAKKAASRLRVAIYLTAALLMAEMAMIGFHLTRSSGAAPKTSIIKALPQRGVGGSFSSAGVSRQ